MTENHQWLVLDKSLPSLLALFLSPLLLSLPSFFTEESFMDLAPESGAVKWTDKWEPPENYLIYCWLLFGKWHKAPKMWDWRPWLLVNRWPVQTQTEGHAFNKHEDSNRTHKSCQVWWLTKWYAYYKPHYVKSVWVGIHLLNVRGSYVSLIG